MQVRGRLGTRRRKRAYGIYNTGCRLLGGRLGDLSPDVFRERATGQDHAEAVSKVMSLADFKGSGRQTTVAGDMQHSQEGQFEVLQPHQDI